EGSPESTVPASPAAFGRLAVKESPTAFALAAPRARHRSRYRLKRRYDFPGPHAQTHRGLRRPTCRSSARARHRALRLAVGSRRLGRERRRSRTSSCLYKRQLALANRRSGIAQRCTNAVALQVRVGTQKLVFCHTV